jgi:bacterioferritin
MIVKGRNLIKTKGGILFMENKEKLLKMLNNALAQEHACQIRYLTHAAVITGPYAELVANRLKEIAEDEKNHAIQLRDRITALGGTPTMEVANKDLIYAKTLKEILDVNIREEEGAIQLYGSILEAVGHEGAILFETVEDILKDEQEHKEELERLRE